VYAKDNPGSWRQIHDFVDEFSDEDPYWAQWKRMVRGVRLELEQRGLVPLFRIGQSMHHIILSTLDRHVLEREPRVTLEFNVPEGSVRIAYSDANLYFNEPSSEESVPVEDATRTVLLNLRRLWVETKVGEAVPDALSVQ
jgi:hypothetical protein